MSVKVKFDNDPANLKATALILDLRNSTKLHRYLSKKKQRTLIVNMMMGIHQEILTFLYDYSGVDEKDFAFNDTGDGYIVVFTNTKHAFTCVLCAAHLRQFLRGHIDIFNRKLKIDQNDLKYNFGMGVHTAYARIIEMKYQIAPNKETIKKFILGNAANSASRVESMTKNFLDIDLLITGYTRKKSHQQADKKIKYFFKKNGDYMTKIGDVRHVIGDGKADGHSLYNIDTIFYDDYKKSAL